MRDRPDHLTELSALSEFAQSAEESRGAGFRAGAGLHAFSHAFKPKRILRVGEDGVWMVAAAGVTSLIVFAFTLTEGTPANTQTS